MNEYHTSMMCSQCGIELVARKNTIRFYECNTCKTTGNGGTLIDLVVNKDRSAALGMVRIFTSLFAFGTKPSFYSRSQNQDTTDGNDAVPGTSKSIVMVNRKRNQQEDIKRVEKIPRISRETKNRQSRSKGKSPLHCMKKAVLFLR